MSKRKPKPSYVEKLLNHARRYPSPTYKDRRQLDLWEAAWLKAATRSTQVEQGTDPHD